MRTTRNIEQVFSKIKSISTDIRYELGKYNCLELPNFEEIYKNYYKEHKYVSWKVMNKYNYNTYFTETDKKEFDLALKKYKKDTFIFDSESVVRFLQRYILQLGPYDSNPNKIKNSFLKAVEEIDICNNEITIHMLEINDEYMPFANTFALCCFILIYLDNNGYKFKHLGFDEEVLKILYRVVFENKFVFKIYNSQEEINQKFYKKFLKIKESFYGLGYGGFINIIGELNVFRNISVRSRIIDKIDEWKDKRVILSLFKSKKLILKALKQHLFLSCMFSNETITKLPEYAFKPEYWKSLFKKIGDSLPFNIPLDHINLFYSCTSNRKDGFDKNAWIRYFKDDHLIHRHPNNKLDALINKNLISSNLDISEELIKELIDLDAINVIKLSKEYGLNKESVSKCKYKTLINEINYSLFKNANNIEIDSNYVRV
ncbi:hypothetical protein DP067_03530 [Mycoplasmopsis anatis]|uniref:Uncharacterized protein n=1 Tax=Mycoplasmopsis anatis 1340 TaxID=1034808 RepID=F9QCM3_9BACT|nr:hypothetical protein [Mycoplasmopsis anatis]AWX70400.1 hypothetical protein DP067_03530 [Mycoplasmopsis anatis]EGS29519.1 hypothetical protein GIG_00897 [Mycoplasmopsis anatis 1340]VEU73948.1 Uncharacterised protein [Mycoplasmopsis anatis]